MLKIISFACMCMLGLVTVLCSVSNICRNSEIFLAKCLIFIFFFCNSSNSAEVGGTSHVLRLGHMFKHHLQVEPKFYSEQ